VLKENPNLDESSHNTQRAHGHPLGGRRRPISQ